MRLRLSTQRTSGLPPASAVAPTAPLTESSSLAGTSYGYLTTSKWQPSPPSVSLTRSLTERKSEFFANRQQGTDGSLAQISHPIVSRLRLRRTASAPAVLSTTETEWHFAIMSAYHHHGGMRAATLIGALMMRNSPEVALQHAYRLKDTAEKLQAPVLLGLAANAVELSKARQAGWQPGLSLGLGEN